jgi:tetratricopeptide (TPR) repeat protein
MARRVLDVFLSSTAKDLAQHRAAVYERLVRTGVFYCVYQDNFGAQNFGAVDFCREKAQAAELFVGLVGLRRGWEPDGDNAKRSITEMEHDWAKEAGRRRFLWVAPDDFRVPGNLRESDEQHARQMAFRGRVMGAGERIVSHKGFDYDRPELLASEIVEHLLAQVVTSELITQLRPELARQDAGPAEAREPAIAAAVEKLASDRDVDLLALAKDPKGVDVADLEAKLEARAGEHEAAGHIGALASLRSIKKAVAAYAKAVALDSGNAEALFQSGWLAMQAGDLASSERAFRRLLELKDGLPLGRHSYWARLGLGDIAKARGSLGQALAAYRAAEELAERLAKADADNTQWRRDLSVSHDRIGDVLVAQGKLAEALAAFQASLATAERLAKTDADNTQWQRDLSVSQEKIGDVLMAQGTLAGALAAYEASLAIRERLAKADADNTQRQSDLSVSHHRIGDVRRAQGRLAEALAAYQASLAIAERLTTADPGNAEWQYDLGISNERVGNVQFDQGDLGAALKAFQTRQDIISRLTEADPGNAGWQRDLFVSHIKIGDVLRAQGKLADALAAFQAALAIAERLAKADAANSGWQADLAASYGKLGQLLVRMDQPEEALAAFRRGRAMVEPLVTSAKDHALWKEYLSSFDAEIAALTG